jgi:hypothetical protein
MLVFELGRAWPNRPENRRWDARTGSKSASTRATIASALPSAWSLPVGRGTRQPASLLVGQSQPLKLSPRLFWVGQLLRGIGLRRFQYRPSVSNKGEPGCPHPLMALIGKWLSTLPFGRAELSPAGRPTRGASRAESESCAAQPPLSKRLRSHEHPIAKWQKKHNQGSFRTFRGSWAAGEDRCSRI